MKILIVDDHPKIRENIRVYASTQAITAEEAITGVEALEKAATGEYDVILLDINMPLMNGEEFLRLYRERGYSTPILALTSNSLMTDKVHVLDLGADDYVTKPFEFVELFARIRSLARRRERTIEKVIKHGDIQIDPVHMRVFKKGKIFPLGAKEIGILAYLASNLDVPKTKTDILQAVWGEKEEALDLDSITLEVHIAGLRKKLGRDIIMTIRGVGYVLKSTD